MMIINPYDPEMELRGATSRALNSFLTNDLDSDIIIYLSEDEEELLEKSIVHQFKLLFPHRWQSLAQDCDNKNRAIKFFRPQHS